MVLDNEAWNKGWDACFEQKVLSDNPYPEGSEENFWWSAGYREAYFLWMQD